MPDLDKNYLAGLYLDEITLDVMPQEYIDAALEVKLRRDACTPRAGFNCVQDRRVKGGFYYRKAPQGRGVTALPPSKLERALARSQEQSSAKPEMGLLGKAAITAGLTVGGLALTGAVVNAGRSSDPYQDPSRPKPSPSKTTFNPTSVGVASVGAIALGTAGLGLKRKPPLQSIEVQGESVPPTESGKPTVQKSETGIVGSPDAARRKREQAQPPEVIPSAVKAETLVEPPAREKNPERLAGSLSALYGGQSTTRNGFEELDAIRGKKTFEDYSDEEIDNAIASNPIQKIQVKGKTYIRDLDKVSEGVLLNEAVNLRKASSKVNTVEAPEVRRLLEARDRKAANLSKKKDPTPEEKEAFSKLDTAVEEMRKAIGDREKEPVRSGRIKPEKKPPVVQEQKEVEKPAISKPEVKADPQSAQKSKKELKEEESKRLASSIDAIANVNMTAQLRNTKKFSMSDQEVFEEKASPEQKAKLSTTIGKEIEKLGYDTPEGEELRGLHESLTGKKYVQVKPIESKPAAIEKDVTSTKKTTNKGTPVIPPLTSALSLDSVTSNPPKYIGEEIEKISNGIDNAKGSIPALVTQVDPVNYKTKGEISDLIVHAAKSANNELDAVRAYTLPKDKGVIDAMLRQQDVLYRNPSDIEPSLSQTKIRGQSSITSSLDLDSLTPTKPLGNYDPKTIESLANEFVKVGDTVKPIITIQKDPLSHEIVDGHLQYYAAKKASEINPQYTTIRSYPAEDMNHAEAIVSQYEAVRKAIAETDAVRAAVAPKAVPASATASKPVGEKKPRSPSSKSVNTAASTASTPVASIDLKTLQVNISKMETTAKTLEETLSRIQSGKKPLQKSQSALNNMGIDITGFGALDSAKQISKLEKAIAYQREQIQKKQQEGRDYVDGQLNNVAIASSESYLQGYNEIRDKYRRNS
jgi:hypothetical protein